MPLRAKLTGHSISCAAEQTDHIWISNVLLHDSFNSFFAVKRCHSRRNASNVPGPLEARRRLAKRKMNHIATSGSSYQAIQPFLLDFRWSKGFGKEIDEPHWKWEPPWLQTNQNDKISVELRDTWRRGGTRDIISETFPRLPAWLDVKHPLIPPSPPRNWSLEAPDEIEETSCDTQKKTTSPKRTLEDYRQALHTVETLSDLRRLRTRFRNADLDEEVGSTFDFDRILECYKRSPPASLHESLRSVLEFVMDAELDCSRGANLAILMRFLAEERNHKDRLSLRQRTDLVNLVCVQLQASANAEIHIGLLMHHTLSLIGVDPDNESDTVALQLIKTLWESFNINWSKYSIVHCSGICRVLLRHVLELSYQNTVADLVKEIVRTDAQIFGKMRDNALDVNVALQELRTTDDEWHESLTKTAMILIGNATVVSDTPAYGQIGYFLRSIDNPEYIGIWAVRTTEKLLSIWNQTSKKSAALTVMNAWLLAISNCGYSWTHSLRSDTWTTIFGIIAPLVRPIDIIPLLSTLPRYEVSLAITRHWISSSIVDRTESSEMIFRSVSPASQHKRHLVAAIDRPPQDHIPQFHASDPTSLDEHSHDVWIRRVEDGVTRPIKSHKLSTLYQTLLQAIGESASDSWEDALRDFLEVTYALGQVRVFNAIVHFARKSSGLPITIKHRPMLESFIAENSAKRPGDSLRLFNLDSRLALSRCPRLPLDLIISRRSRIHPERIHALLLRRDFHAFLYPAERPYHPSCALTPQRIMLVHEIALAFANAQRFSARTSFDCVERCYAFLRGHHAPLGPLLSRALVISGLVRPMREGQDVALDKLRFILGVVKSIDGFEAGDELDKAVWVYRKRLLQERRRRRGEPPGIINYYDSQQKFRISRNRVEGCEE